MNFFLLPNLRIVILKLILKKKPKSISFSKSKQIMTQTMCDYFEEKDLELLNQYLLYRKLK